MVKIELSQSIWHLELSVEDMVCKATQKTLKLHSNRVAVAIFTFWPLGMEWC